MYILLYLHPYPIFAATYSDGSIHFWCVKPSKFRGDCILRGRNNITWLGKTETIPVYTMLYINRDMNLIPSRGSIQKKVVPLESFYNYEHHKQDNLNNEANAYTIDGKLIVKVPEDEEDEQEVSIS